MQFIITQKEIAILYHIQSVLGFGKIVSQDNFFRFRVTALQDVLLFCQLRQELTTQNIAF